MAFTYKWAITGLKTKNVTNHEGALLENTVCQTYWKLTGTDENGNEGSFSGATPFSASNCCVEDFCEFSNLTEETVLEWIKHIVNRDPTYKAHIDSQIQKQIDTTAVVEATMPWAQESANTAV